MKKKGLMSMEELRKSGKIYWVKSTPSLKKWVLRDIAERNILRAIYVRDKASSKGRWYFNPEYVDEYVREFEKSKVDVGSKFK